VPDLWTYEAIRGGASAPRQVRDQVAVRRGHNIGVIAAARELIVKGSSLIRS
jgi:hypothetical protein